MTGQVVLPPWSAGGASPLIAAAKGSADHHNPSRWDRCDGYRDRCKRSAHRGRFPVWAHREQRTPSPIRLLGATLNLGLSTPATARAAMSTTSSVSRRPLGKPAPSPASRPNRLRFRLRGGLDPGVQPQEIGNRTCRSAGSGNRRGIGHERKEVSPGREWEY